MCVLRTPIINYLSFELRASVVVADVSFEQNFLMQKKITKKERKREKMETTSYH